MSDASDVGDGNGKSVMILTLLLWLASLNCFVSSHVRNVCEVDGVCGGDKCGVYVAPSTIPNAGLGVFTADAIDDGDVVGIADLAVPIVDLQWHAGGGDYFWLFNEYVWQGWTMGMQQESEDEDPEAITAFCPGLDALANCNAALINTGKSMPQNDAAGLHRSRDPGAGAVTPYQNGTTLTTAAIPAGGELFKYYGDNWFKTRTPEFGLIPLQNHYTEAERLLHRYASLELFLSDKAMETLWSKLVTIIPWESRFYNALPKTSHEALLGARQGIRSIHQPKAIRSFEFLEKHGRCMDNIYPAQSTIPGAGRGAFATRFLEQGSIITGSPLLHVPFRHIMNMYSHYHNETHDNIRNTSEIIGYQLLRNYCYGYHHSPLLLCPYGGGVGFINHNQSQANVKLQWAPNGFMSQNDTWFDLEPSQMEWHYRVNLALDYVATRDILPGEELFLDYGDEWEEAWQLHVRTWEPPEGSEEYISAVEMNKQLKGKMLRTQSEQEIEPYPDNLEIRCHSEFDNQDIFLIDEWERLERGIACDILSRGQEDGAFVYQVEFHDRIGDDGKPLRQTVPRVILKFVDVPYTTDLHLRNAFRHEIVIPDEIFPARWKWKNWRNEEQKWIAGQN